MDITSFRAAYPQYNDLPDEEIVKRLHGKFHQTEDYSAFRSRFLGHAPIEEGRAKSIEKFGPPGTPLPQQAVSPPAEVAGPATSVAPETTPVPEMGAVAPKMGTPVDEADLKQGILTRGEPSKVPWREVFKPVPAQIKNFGEGVLGGDRLQTLEAELEAAKRGKAFDPMLESGAIRDPIALARAYEELDKRQPRQITEIEADIAAAMGDEQARVQRGAELAAPLADASTFQKGVNQALTSMPISGAALVTGIATRSAPLAAMSLYPVTQAESYGRLRAQGVDHDTAIVHSRVQGTAESATEMLPFHVLLKRIPGASKLLQTIGAELGGETLAQLVQGSSDYVAAAQARGAPVTGALVWDGLVEASYDLPVTWVATALGSAAQTGAVTLTDKALNPQPTEQEADLIGRAHEAYVRALADSMAELSGQKMPQSMRQQEAARRAQEAALQVIAERSPVDAARLRLNKLEKDAAAGKTVDPAQLEEAREALEQATVESVRGKLRKGELTPEQQQEAAQALRDMDSAPEEGAGEVRGVVRPEKPVKGQQTTEPTPKGVPTAKPDAPLTEVETARQDALNRVANADTIEEAALNDLIAEGLAKINPQTQRPVLLPPGKRQRIALNKRAEAAEEAEKKAVEPEAAPKLVAEKPQPKSPKKSKTVVAKPQTAQAAPTVEPPAAQAAPKPKKPRAKKAAAVQDSAVSTERGQTVDPDSVVDNDGTDFPEGSVTANFGGDDETHISYLLKPDGVAEVSGMYAKGKVRGTQMLEWLRSQPGVKTIVPKDVAPDAVGFWRKAKRRGLLKGAQQDEDFDRDGPEADFVPSQPIEAERMDEPGPGPAFAVAAAPRSTPRAVPLGTAEVDKIKRDKEAWREKNNYPANFEQDNPGLRGDDNGREWLAGKQEAAEEDMANARKRGDKTGSAVKGLYGSTTAWVRGIELPVSEVAKLPGVMGEENIRKPGEGQYDTLQKAVREKGWNQEWPILILVNHKGEAFISEGNTRTRIARDIGQPTIKAEIRWQNGGELVDGPFSPTNVKHMTEPAAPPSPAFAVAEDLPRNEQGQLLAPNGKPSKLTENQWRQVRTPEFKAWFGDWEKFALQPGGVWNDDKGEVSKVVDPETGEPMVVYHGTTRGGFHVFDKAAATGHLTSAPAGTAFFTNDRHMAATYSGSQIEVDLADTSEPPDGYYVRKDEDGTWYVSADAYDTQPPSAISWGFESEEEAIAEAHELAPSASERGLYSVFLNIRNPQEHDFEGANWNGSRDHQWVVLPRTRHADEEAVEDDGPIPAPDGTIYFETQDEARRLSARTPGTVVRNAGLYFMHESTDQVVREDKALPSLDGSIIRNVIDEGQYYGGSGPNDVFVAFDPTQIKSATQNRGTFDPKNPDITFATNDAEVRAAVFYSAVRRAVENAKITKGTGEQWFNTIRNTPGVKAEEIEWMDLGSALTGLKSVTKEEVAAYVAAHEVKVEEVVRGELSDEEREAFAKQTFDDMEAALGRPPSDQFREAVRRHGTSRKPAKFDRSDLLTPGGENYRELLLTLPSTVNESARSATRELAALREEVMARTGLDEFSAASEMNADERARFDRLVGRLRNQTTEATFTSGHWDEPNVLAHIRFNERTDSEGRRTLFIEEIQSDWHQKGRKQGYAKSTAGWTAHPLHTPESGFNHWRIDDADGNRVTNIVGGTAESAIRTAAEGIPNAPFKTSWPELALKRAIRWAAENGFDQVAWTTGEMQNARYDLSQHIDSIVVTRGARGYALAAYKDHGPVIAKNELSADELAQHIGKDAAEKAIAKINDETDSAILQGLDLEVGGEGMRGFYDKILVAAADKIGKKYGTKTARSSLGIADASYSGPVSGSMVLEARGIPAEERDYYWRALSEADRIEYMEDYRRKRGKKLAGTAVHSLRLTPELKTAALGGFPLFAANRPGVGLPVSEIENIVRPLEKLFGVPIKVVPTPDGLRKGDAEYAAARNLRIAGRFYDDTGEVYLVASGIDTPQQAIEFYLHEVVGHKGLRALLGPAYDRVMDQIIKDFRGEVVKAQKRNGIGKFGSGFISLEKLAAGQRRLAAEESVAYATQALLGKTGGKDQRTIWRKLVDYVRVELMKLGLLKNLKRSDIDALIMRARDYARREARRQTQRAYEAKAERARDKAAPIPKPNPVNDGPLLGMPTVQTIPGIGQVKAGPHAPARQAAANYRRSAGIRTPEVRTYVKVNEAHAKRIAQAYQNMKHDPLDPRVKAAYDALIRETLAQYQLIKATGLKVEFIPEGQDPYAASPRMAIEDVRNNNHLWVFPTDSGYGMDKDAEFLKNNPLLQPTDEYIGRRQLLANDVFRIVHDYFGHIQEGNGFRADGEENAWRIHASMYTPLARAAMTSETRGQNSWLNFGPHGKKNRNAKNAETVYAEQKIGLLPPEFWNPEPETAALAVRSDRVTPLPSRELARKARMIFQRTIDAPESGFSLDVYGNAAPAVGYTLATDKATERSFNMIPTADEMAAYLDEHRGKLEAGAQFFGGWRAGPAGTNRYVLDIATWMADRDEALAAAKAAEQEGIYDLAKGETVYLPGFGPQFAVADEVADTIRNIARHLTPEERTKLNRSTARKLVDLFESLPDEKERGAVALAGAAAKGWYRDSAETIVDIFGPDAPRFAALLAALSPRVDVQSNLKHAVAVWGAWVNAGRPTTKAEIVKVMQGSLWGAVDRDGETVNVLPAWINNTVRSLTSETPESIVLSGPKVSSFAANLRGEVDQVTLDSWMAAFDKVEGTKFFPGTINKAGTDPGKRAGYLAVSARVRQTAAYLTKKTGEVWTPAEVQETIWSWTKTLAEMAYEMRAFSSAEQIVKNGELTNELVNATVNFATLFALPEQQEVLRNLGYGERLDRANERAQARASSGRKAPALSGADQKRVLTAARRLDALRAEKPSLGRRGKKAEQTATQEDVLEAAFAVNDEQEAAFSVLSGNTGDPDIDEFMSGIGDRKRTLGQFWQDTTENLSARAQMAIFDDLYGIKRAGDIAGLSMADVGFKNAHLAKSAAELTQATIEYGYPVWHRDGTHMVAGVEGGQGFIDILKPLGDKLNLWAAWMVARRANRLMGEGRERHFKQAGIDKVLALGNQHPEFQMVADAYAEFQKKVLDFAQEAGVIDPDTRALWENADYIPFYRIIESGQIQGPNAGGALGKVRNQIRRLRGGEANIGDPLENIARNWYSLFDASLKAHAARTVVDALDGSGLVTRAPQVEITTALVLQKDIEKFIKNNPILVQHLQSAGVDVAKLPPAAFAGIQKMLAVQPPSGEDIISVWRNGKREYWHVHDDLLFESLMNVNKAAWGPLMEFFRFPKRFGTAMITTTAAFGVKNFFRDMLHTFVQGSTDAKTTIIPGLDSIKGAISQFRMDEASQALLAGGGSFTHGYIRAGDTAGAAATIRRSLRKADPSSAVLDTPMKVFRFHRDLLNAAENAHRAAIYSKMRKKGASRLDAMYEARDLLDFAKHGNNVVIQFLTQSVMFLNARMQGLYRLGRGASAGRAALSIFMRGSLYMAGMLALLASQYDDERYKALTDADKASYIHFFDVFNEGDHYRLPVPFEVGTIFGTFPVAIAEALLSKETDAGKQAFDMFKHAIVHSLDLSPDVQTFMPLLELSINRDTFTKAPILTMGDEAVLPEEQDDPRLSPTLRGLARAMPDAAPEALRSPKQLNHLVRGYTGPVLDYALFATDAIVRRAMGEPAPATKTLRDYPDIKAFVQTGPQRMTRYQNDMFDIADKAERVAASIRRLENIGTDEATARIERLEAENYGLLNVREDFRDAAQEVIDLRKTMREIQLDRDMTPEEKREELDAMQNEINEIALDVWGLRPGGPLNPDVAIELLDKDEQGQVDVLTKNKLSATARALQELE